MPPHTKVQKPGGRFHDSRLRDDFHITCRRERKQTSVRTTSPCSQTAQLHIGADTPSTRRRTTHTPISHASLTAPTLPATRRQRHHHSMHVHDAVDGIDARMPAESQLNKGPLSTTRRQKRVAQEKEGNAATAIAPQRRARAHAAQAYSSQKHPQAPRVDRASNRHTAHHTPHHRAILRKGKTRRLRVQGGEPRAVVHPAAAAPCAHSPGRASETHSSRKPPLSRSRLSAFSRIVSGRPQTGATLLFGSPAVAAGNKTNACAA